MRGCSCTAKDCTQNKNKMGKFSFAWQTFKICTLILEDTGGGIF